MTILLRVALALLVMGLVLLVAFGRARSRLVGFRPRERFVPQDAFPQGERAPLTAIYFTSRLCAACEETAGILRDAAPGIPAIALPVHERPDLVRRLGVRETPTLLLVERNGRIRYAVAGNPALDDLRRAAAGTGGIQ